MYVANLFTLQLLRLLGYKEKRRKRDRIDGEEAENGKVYLLATDITV